MSVATAPKPVSTATRASLIEELHREPGKAEIIKGKVVRMSPAAWWHGQGSGAIYISLTEHKKKHGGGSGCADNVGFLVDLPDRYSFSPDAAWHTGPFPALSEGDAFVEGAPRFAAEIRSVSQYGPAADENILLKIREYFQAGTLVLWDIDYHREKLIRKYTPETLDNPAIFHQGDIADAEPAVPGWRFPVNELFA